MSDSNDVSEKTPVGRQPDVIDADEDCVAVDAGAGTGKTTTMVWKIEELINSGEISDPSRIQVLTFANEAAASIQQDINDADNLTSAEAYNINVSTYHSFCNRLVSEYAYQIGIDPEFEVITQDKRIRILHQLIATGEYEYVGMQDGSPEAVVERADRFIGDFRQEGVTPAEIDKLLPSEQSIKELQRFLGLLKNAAEELLQFEDWGRIVDFDEYDAKTEPLRGNLEEYKKVLIHIHQEAKEHINNGDDVETWKAVAAYMEFLVELANQFQQHLETEPDWVYALLPQAMFANEVVQKYWPDLSQTPIDYFEQYIHALDEVYRLQPIYEEYQNHLRKKGALDFDELIERAAELISDPVVRTELQNRWDYIFCDEFQDTDSAQLDVVTELCADSDTQLLAIGDTNQAIYSWRGANPEGLTSLDKIFNDQKSIELIRNFRSEQEILDLVNLCDGYNSKDLISQSIFDSDDQESTTEGQNPSDRTTTDFSLPIELSKDSADDEPHLATVHSSYTQLSTPEEVGTTVSLLLENRFDDISERTLGDIAIVARKNWHIEAIAAELDNRQIPYTIDGGSAGDAALEPGLQTLISYLKSLVRPEEDIHLYRVLMLLYRIPNKDLQQLVNSPHDSLKDSLINYEDISGASFTHPEKIARARDSYITLQKLSDTQALQHFYQNFIDTTRIEWFIQDRSREKLSKVQQFIDAYQPDVVLKQLSADFVDHLESYLQGSNADNAHGIANKADNKVNLMTIHQAKGLQFDTVLFPYLNTEDWYSNNSGAWRAHHFKSIIKHATDDDFSHPLSESVYRYQIEEDWRVFHVGATRAESLLVLFGEQSQDPDFPARSAEDIEARYNPREILRDKFGSSITPWALDMPTASIWERIFDAFQQVSESNEETVVNLTSGVEEAGDLTLGNLLYFSTQLQEVNEAVDKLYELMTNLQEGTISPTDPSSLNIESPDLSALEEPQPPIVHSNTAYETFKNCSRRHMLDHVLYAIQDPIPANSGVSRSDDPSPKTVGTIFHDVAEESFYRNTSSKSEWMELAERVCTARNEEAALPKVKESINRYFTTDVPTWDAIGAEVPFELTNISTVEGPIVGYIDSIRQHPEKGLVVLDYKTSYDTLDLENSSQLLIYLKACEELFDEKIEWAGYVYVGEAADENSSVEFTHKDKLETEWSNIIDMLQDADNPIWKANEGDHCEYCPHRSIGCALDEHKFDNEFVADIEE